MNNNENNNLHVPRISNDEFIESYIKLTKKIMQRIANKQLIYLQKYAVHHKVYGELNLLELIFLTIQLNYIAINKYKNLLCEDFYKVA